MAVTLNPKDTLNKIDTSKIDSTLYDTTKDLNIDFRAENVIINLLSGKGIDFNKGFFENLSDLFFLEIRNALKGAVLIFSIIIICSLISVLQTSFAQSEVSNIANSICIVSSSFVVVSILKQLVSVGIGSINSSIVFIKSLGPAMALLLFASGQPIASGSFAMWLFLLVEGMVSLISYVFIPLLYCYLAISIADSIFSNISMKKVADLIKGFISFGLGLMLTVFTSVISIQSIAQNIGDMTANKAVKYTISSAVPVVGKIISDAADVVISFSHILKNAFGLFGIICVILIFLIPIIKIGVQIIVFKVINALAHTLGNSQISNLLECFCSTIMLIFSISISVCIFIIISLGLIVISGVK